MKVHVLSSEHHTVKKEAAMQNAVTPNPSLFGKMLWLLRLPHLSGLKELATAGRKLVLSTAWWKASVIKGFSFCAGWWQFHDVFSELKEVERKKSFTNWRGSTNSAAISASPDEKPIRSVLSITSIRLGFLEGLILCLFYFLHGMFCWHCTQSQIKALVSWQWRGKSQALLWALNKCQGS